MWWPECRITESFYQLCNNPLYLHLDWGWHISVQVLLCGLLWKLSRKIQFFKNGQIFGYCMCRHNYILLLLDSKLSWKHPVWLKRYKTVIPFVFVYVCLSLHSSIPIYQHGYHWTDISVKFGIGYLCEDVKKNPNLVKIRKNIGHFRFRCEYVLLLVNILNCHRSALFGWNIIRLLGMAEEV
jgi:hypothetical protein